MTDVQAFEIVVNELRERLGYDEDTIGCCLSNFGDGRICEAMKSTGCRKMMLCIRISTELEEILK